MFSQALVKIGDKTYDLNQFLSLPPDQQQFLGEFLYDIEGRRPEDFDLSLLKQHPQLVGCGDDLDELTQLCVGCGGLGTVQRQNSNYLDDDLNYCCLCPACQDHAAAYWDDMWRDYWQGRL